jgi:activator of Hsp90 ATPase-like protein
VTAPLELAFDLDCRPTEAFDVWTDRFSAWWPDDHTVTGDPAVVVLEPRLGGRIYERAHDGTEHEWGEVTAWEPPGRLCYLWHLHRDRSDATEVEIRFVGLESGTRVEIEHRGWERLGADGSAWRERNQTGWQTLLPHFIATIKST